MSSIWYRTSDLADMSREDMEFWRDCLKDDPDLFKEETPQARPKPKSSYQRRGLAPRCPVCMRDGCSGHVEPPPPPPCQCPVCMGESRPLPGMPISERTPWYESPYATFGEPFYDDPPFMSGR